ncbi:contractile injection system protein, VgrG/Pvc8 family [Micromonospora soli]|uniref:phage late control D family protein n=1 Tax=Micromonospora sp. NBRC 110009 TaxID=3061627 RepID=UPI0026729D74|nr:contractile injection system protein, VgrG/Pvc8 family [Micromonospora sp. NBRC 110009]WKT96876.1 contractile injection system protein, VgrG/Pvc8 family [Micromonospora sp. NBRC 110009]
MTEAPLTVVSPVFTVDGQLMRELARDCFRLDVCEGVEGLRKLQACFLATGAGALGPPGDLLHLDGGTIDLGKSLRVAIGAQHEQRFVFDGKVSAIELTLGDADPPYVTVFAEDALMGLRMTRRMRTYRDKTDAEVAAELAREHGLQADTDADGPRYDVVQQFNQSDLAFLRERARLVQAEIWCTERTLHFRTRSQRTGSEVTLVRGGDLIEARLTADLSAQRSAVVVTGYDADRREVINEKAGPDALDAEVTGGRLGARLVERALGASTTLRVREAALTSAEASAWARAEMLRRGRKFVTVNGTTNGTPDLMVGSRLTLQRSGAPFDGSGYYVTRVRHTFDLRRGFRTCFDAERATLNEVA